MANDSLKRAAREAASLIGTAIHQSYYAGCETPGCTDETAAQDHAFLGRLMAESITAGLAADASAPADARRDRVRAAIRRTIREHIEDLVLSERHTHIETPPTICRQAKWLVESPEHRQAPLFARLIALEVSTATASPEAAAEVAAKVGMALAAEHWKTWPCIAREISRELRRDAQRTAVGGE